MNDSNRIVYKDNLIAIFEINSKKYGIHHVTIDVEDICKIKKNKWHVNYDIKAKRYTSIRACPKYKMSPLKLHKVLTKFENMADHINGDIFDNRKINLRNCSYRENGKNVGKHRDNVSGYKGITITKSGKFRARITINYNTVSLGTYNYIDEAIQAYDTAAKKYFGEFVRLNE